MIMFKRRKLIKRLASLGSVVDISFMLYINNEDPMSFPDMDSLKNYLKQYRDNNVISRLQIFRIETYSL